MKLTLKDRHLFGAGAAACAVCCAVPLMALIGIAGTAATVATFAFAGAVFGLIVAAGAILTMWTQRRRRATQCADPSEPVDIEIVPRGQAPAGVKQRARR